MRKTFITLFSIFSVLLTGCVPVLIGVAGYGAYRKLKKSTVERRPKLTEMQRRVLECKELEGTREDVLRAVVTVFQDKGFTILTSDYEGGIISARLEKPYRILTASIEEFTVDRIKMRISMKDQDGVIEDEQVFAHLFDDIQTEIFRRTNLSN